MSELLAPGGSFAAAVRAFENGADAVYLGLSEFSARRGAVNFDLEQLRRLRGAFPARSIYLALNTLVPDQSLPRAASLLMDACDAGIDALIVQDPGIARLARCLQSDLPLHASTQMAVHNPDGARELFDAGFARVVLARECTLAEIRNIQESVPGLELEVFIHGAMCYGFSGLCQASGYILGRSANRGACGQICRTWFEDGTRNIYLFSQNDLFLGDAVRDLAAIGVASLKIEGRMKSPEYVGEACALYRRILDGGPDTAALAEAAALRFSRNQIPGWIPGGKGRDMVNPAYPGPTGIPAGRVISTDERGALVEAEAPLASRDGLLWFRDGNPPEPVRDALRFRERSRHSLEAGRRAWLDFDRPPDIGRALRLLSRASGHRPDVNAASYPPAKTPLELTVRPVAGGLSFVGRRGSFEWEFLSDGELEQARSPGRFTDAVEKAFGASGESLFLCRPIRVESPEGGPEPFVPPKQMKALRRRFLDGFAKAYGDWKAQRLRDALEMETDALALPTGPPRVLRTALIAPDWAPLPFPADPMNAAPADLPVVEGVRYLPLPPVDFSLSDHRAILDRIGSMIEAAESSLRIGLNGPHHVWLARRLAAERPEDLVAGRLSFFLDYGLYVVNHQAWVWYRERIPGLRSFVQGLESTADGWTQSSNVPAIDLGVNFPMPLFISRTCPIRHAGIGNHGPENTCPPGCPGNRDEEILQNGRRYRIAVRDCLAYVLPG